MTPTVTTEFALKITAASASLDIRGQHAILQVSQSNILAAGMGGQGPLTFRLTQLAILEFTKLRTV